MNLITPDTKKETVREVYRNYPDTQPDGFLPFHSARVDPIFWDIPDNVSVLDIGCNSGAFLERLKNARKGVTLKGVDISENAVNIAKGKGLDVILGDGEELPFPDASFDYVVLMEVLVHVHEPKKLLAEIRRVLKKDGVLIGSCPHKNLEINIWDDARLHHAYYSTAELITLLKEFFPGLFIKTLKAAQFSIGFAQSHFADEEAEILFKCGSNKIKPWNWQLELSDSLRVWMGPTQNAGVAYYRMTGFAEKMNKLDRTDILYHGFDPRKDDGPALWQNALIRQQGNIPSNRIVLNQLEGLLKLSQLSVWQITQFWDVLAFYECLKHVQKKPFVTEMDDWLFDLPSYNIASHPYRPNSDAERIAYAQLQMSDAVICSTKFIKENVEALFPGKRAYVIPNAIDLDLWDNAEPKPLVKKEPGRIRIAFTGCANHGGDLELVKKPLLAILNEFPNVEFLCCGAMRRGRDGEQFLLKHERSFTIDRWSAISDWPAAVRGWQIDIGIAPLWDFNFNRAKSNLRWLEYSALGVPTVASKVRPFAESIRDSIDGFLCASQSDWYRNLKTLIEDAEYRRWVGHCAYKRIDNDFNMDRIAKTYKSVLEGIRHEFGRNMGRVRTAA